MSAVKLIWLTLLVSFGLLIKAFFEMTFL